MNNVPHNPLVAVISAPSGAGKTTLCQNLVDTMPHMARAVTCTTRPQRGEELDGTDYYFLSEKEFAKRDEGQEFLEHAFVHGNRYGVLKSELKNKLEQGLDVLLNIDVQGAASVRREAASQDWLARSMVTVLLCTASLVELEQRLQGRNTDTKETVQRRLATAREELDRWGDFDFLLISQSREEDLRRMKVILEAERMRTIRNSAPAGALGRRKNEMNLLKIARSQWMAHE